VQVQTIQTPEHPRSPHRVRARKLFEPELVRVALKEAFAMLRPGVQWSNPVMFVMEIGPCLHCCS
jgi:K+-transporting ATPase ATPase B chain